MKKFYLMLLAATTLSFGFTACGNDDEDNTPKKETNNGQGENNQGDNGKTDNGNGETEGTAAFDYSEAIGMNVNQILAKYGEPSMNFETFYSYSFTNQKVSSVTLMLNADNQQVYNVMEILTEGAYTAEELQAYFGKKYTFYLKEDIPGDEEEGIAPSASYTYGNTEKQEDATLVITVSGNSSISYENPKNTPADVPGEEPFEEFSPIDVIGFIGQSWADIEEDYEEAFMEMGAAMQYASCGDNDWMSGFALTLTENLVTSISIFFDDGLETSEILDFFREEGWAVRDTGETNEDEGPIYEIVKDNISLKLSSEIGTVTTK